MTLINRIEQAGEGEQRAELMAAVVRLMIFRDEWRKLPQKDDVIYGLHSGHEREAECRLSDIETLLSAILKAGERG